MLKNNYGLCIYISVKTWGVFAFYTFTKINKINKTTKLVDFHVSSALSVAIAVFTTLYLSLTSRLKNTKQELRSESCAACNASLPNQSNGSGEGNTETGQGPQAHSRSKRHRSLHRLRQKWRSRQKVLEVNPFASQSQLLFHIFMDGFNWGNSTKDLGQKPFTFQVGQGQVIKGNATSYGLISRYVLIVIPNVCLCKLYLLT